MDALTPEQVEAMARLVDDAALGEWQVGDVIHASGLREYDVYEGDDDDANSMALCYEERVAKFIAAAPDFCRVAIAALRAPPVSDAALMDALAGVAHSENALEQAGLQAEALSGSTLAALLDDIVDAQRMYIAVLETALYAAERKLAARDEPY